MNTLLRLLRRYRNVLYFLLLECVALLLHTQFSYTQKARIGALMNGVEAYAEDRASAMRRYTDLEGENARLVEENIALRNAHERLRYMLSRQRITDSSANGQFCYHTAHVVNNTVSLPRNLFTIDRGRADGVHDGMGVLAYGNVVGIVVAVAPHYSKAISLLNKDLRISARLSRTGYFGSVGWDGVSYRTALLAEIPNHVDVRAGDTVVASGYSGIFPPGAPIGYVESVLVEGSDFKVAQVRLAVDFMRLEHVTVVENRQRNELDSLQANTQVHAE